MAPALVSAGALLATSIVLLTEILGISRQAFAMAHNGDLPQTLSRLSQVKRVPRNAVMACGAILPVLAVSMDLRPALQASSMALLFYYGIMNLRPAASEGTAHGPGHRVGMRSRQLPGTHVLTAAAHVVDGGRCHSHRSDLPRDDPSAQPRRAARPLMARQRRARVPLCPTIA